MKTNRIDCIQRCFKLIRLFESGQVITVKRVMEHLGVSKQVAQRWINAASIEMPVYEVGEIHNGEIGPNPIGYQLLDS